MLASLIVNMLAVGLAAYLLPGVALEGVGPAFLAVIVLGVINAIIKPLLLLLTLPINFLTLGLFTFVINALVIMMTSSVVPGFKVDGFGSALLFSIVLGVVNSLISSLVK